jgi:hypothetical protein
MNATESEIVSAIADLDADLKAWDDLAVPRRFPRVQAECLLSRRDKIGTVVAVVVVAGCIAASWWLLRGRPGWRPGHV